MCHSPISRLVLLCAALALPSGSIRAATDLEGAKALLQSGFYPAARKAYEDLLKEDPSNPEIVAGLAAVEIREQRIDEGIERFEQAIKLDPDNSEYYVALAGAYDLKAHHASFVTKADWITKARRTYEKAVEVEPGNPHAVGALVRFYLATPPMVGGGAEKALKAARALAEKDPYWSSYYQAEAYEHEKRWSEAEAAWRKAMEAKPEEVDAKVRFGAFLARSGQVDRAFDYFQELAKNDPRDLFWVFQIGATAARTGERTEEGLQALRRYLKEGKPGQGVSPAVAHWCIGQIEEKRGDRRAARRAYEESLRLDPRFGPARQALENLR